MSLDSASELNALELPIIEPVKSQNTKRSLMKKKLSKIAFSLSSNEVQPSFDYHIDNSSFSYDDPNLLNNDYQQNRLNLSLQDKSSTLNPVSKFSKSTSNLTNTNHTSNQTSNKTSNPKNVQKTTRSSSPSLSSISSVSPQQQNLSILPIQPPLSTSRTSSISNSPNHIPNKQIPNYNNSNNHYTYSSPSKINARSLATDNDHTFIITNNSNHSLQLPTTSYLKPQSHSATPSISNSITPESLSKSIPASSLPQFTSINQSNNVLSPSFGSSNANSNSNSVLVPPTVLAPIYKTPSSNSSSHQSTNSTSLSISTNNNFQNSNSNVVHTSSASDSLKHKRGTGLLQSAYRTSHHLPQSTVQNNTNFKPKDKHDLLDDDDKEDSMKYASIYTSDISLNQSKFALNSSQYALSNTNKSKSNDNLQNINDIKIHLISPKIISEFHSLQGSIQAGLKKRLEFLDKENGSIIADINSAYDKLTSIQSQLVSQIKDLDNYIEDISSKKERDLKNLLEDVLFENLNDLTVRIDAVKDNMTSNKEIIKTFDNKLKILNKMRSKNEARNKNIQQSFIMASCIIVCFFSIKWYVF